MGMFGSGGGSTISTSEPRLGALRVQQSTYGLVVPIIYGRARVPGNLLWYGDFTAIAHTTRTESGGGGKGGGGGGVTQESTTYTYEAALIIALAEGQISGIPTVWRGKEVFTGADALAKVGLALATGSTSQPAWGHLQTYHPEQALGYSQTAYVYGANYQLTSNAEVYNHTFEVDAQMQFGGGIVDANPRDVIADFLSNQRYGAGFPSAKLGDLALYSDYCVASGLFISPAFSEQRQAQEHLQDLMTLSNSAPLWSEGKLKIIPYGDEAITGNGRTYTPNLTPIYDLTDDDFLIGSSEDPVKVERKTSADAFNQVQVEFLNRENQYNIEIAEAKDQANIEQFGLRPKDALKLHAICDAAVARRVAQMVLQRALYIRNQYEFRLGWKYALLEPMDLVTLTDTAIGLDRTPVRITEIEEDEDGGLTVKAEDFPQGTASAAQYPSQSANGFAHDHNADPGKVLAPVFFETPFDTSGSVLKVRIAVTGDNVLWGGCQVHASLDGNTYKQVDTIVGGARYGTLTAPIDSVATGPLSVQLVGKGGQILSGTALDAEQMTTACWVDGEYVGYTDATLTGANRYDLSGLVRGGYGSTPAAHTIGRPFVRIDDTVAESGPLDLSMRGQTVWFKFCSFNVFGGGTQQIADVPAYSYVVQGTALTLGLPNVQNLLDVLRDGRTVLRWNPVDDPRLVDYEVRKGATWQTAQIVGRTQTTEFVTDGDGSYWVAAHAELAYSTQPTGILIEGGTLVANVVATFDEEADSWPGACAGGAAGIGTDISLSGAGLFSAIPLMSGISSVFYYGGAAASGSYTIPASHEVDIGVAQPCNCSVSYRMRADSPYALFSALPSVAAQASIAGDYAGQADAKVQIAIAPDSGVYGAWRDFVPGSYVGRKFKFRVNLTSNDPSVIAVLDKFAFTVDMPDRSEKGTAIACPDGGMSITYDKPFQIVPNVQITILGAQQNDDIVLSNQTPNGFTVQIQNGGVGVARTLNWIAQSY